MAAMRGVEERPAGLAYRTAVLSESDEAALLDRFRRLDFEAVVMRGQAARRTVRHFGFTYAYESWDLVPAEPLPDYLHELRATSAELAGVEPASFEQALVTRYPAGATIGWHKDASAFGAVVAGVSLASDCVMRFQRRAAGGERRVFEQPLERRSGYVLTGAARSAWQHSIPAVSQERYSVTFRTVRARARP
jgi:alkylated DNA repair dioxygenase AlkB